jgi:hypothetical protein
MRSRKGAGVAVIKPYTMTQLESLFTERLGVTVAAAPLDIAAIAEPSETPARALTPARIPDR